VIGVPGTGSFIEPDVSSTTRMFDCRCSAVHWVTIWLTPSTFGSVRGAATDPRKPRLVASDGASLTVRSGPRNPSVLNALRPAGPRRYCRNSAAADLRSLSTHGALSAAYG